jgi:hypothetical protein
MKRIVTGVFVVLAVLSLALPASAVDQKNTGCGLGSMVFEGQNGLVSQTFAVTTNGTFGNQTFGITSGTSNCEQFKTFAMNEKVNTFVAENMDGLAKDMARGEGEYLATLAGLMEVDQVRQPRFNALLQQNFSRIYTSPAVTPAEVLANISHVASSM